jgi:hypothetical protein
MTDEHENEGNPTTAKKAVYYIIIETTEPVEDTEWQMNEVNELTEQMGRMIDFGATIWVDEVEYDDEANTSEED